MSWRTQRGITLDLYLDLLIKLLSIIAGGCILFQIIGCRSTDQDDDKHRWPLATVRIASKDAGHLTSQWFVDLDQNTETGYGGKGYDVLQRPDGVWRATLPPILDGDWGPETDCVLSGTNVRGRTEQYTGLPDSAILSGAWDEWRTISCTQTADRDADGDVDLRDAAAADLVGDLGRVIRRLTGP